MKQFSMRGKGEKGSGETKKSKKNEFLKGIVPRELPSPSRCKREHHSKKRVP